MTQDKPGVDSWDELYVRRRNRRVPAYIFEHFVDALQAHLGTLHGAKVLEIAAGSGATSLSMAAQGAVVVALDKSSEAIRTMRQTIGIPGRVRGSMHAARGDALALPFRDACFDSVFHQGFLEHFSDPTKLLREQYRVLRSGGLIMVQVPQTFNVYTVLKKVLIALHRWPYGRWETQFSRRAIEQVLRSVGFSVQRSYGFGSFRRALVRRLGFSIPLHRETSSKLLHRWRLYTAIDICTLGVKP